MLLKNSDKSVNFRYVFLPLVSRLTASGSLFLRGGVVVGRTLGLRGVRVFGDFCSMGVCLSLGFGMRQDGFLQNIADKQWKSAPRVILPKRRHKNCFLALAVLVGQEACWLVRSTRLPALVARRLGLSKSDYQK